MSARQGQLEDAAEHYSEAELTIEHLMSDEAITELVNLLVAAPSGITMTPREQKILSRVRSLSIEQRSEVKQCVPPSHAL